MDTKSEPLDECTRLRARVQELERRERAHQADREALIAAVAGERPPYGENDAELHAAMIDFEIPSEWSALRDEIRTVQQTYKREMVVYPMLESAALGLA